MKKIRVAMVTGMLLVLLNVQAFAQSSSKTNSSVIEPYRLSITFYKTTNLIFPYAIKSVDRGSKDILAQKAEGVENVLQLKAGKKDFVQTNLTVITADGKLYSYILNYTDTPTVLNIRFDNTTAPKPEAFFSNVSLNKAEIKANADTIPTLEETIRGSKDKSYGMSLQLSGLYIKGDVLFLRLTLQNRTNINYDIDQLRFYIRDQKEAKRTASQELEIKPLYVRGNSSVIAGQTEKIFVYAVPKFTIPDKKYLAIELMEKNGGRHLKLKVHNKTIVQAKSVQ